MKRSAGVVPYAIVENIPHFLLGLPGGPHYCNFDKDGHFISYKDQINKWSILKGGIEKGETKKQAAMREFHEESGFSLKGRKKELISLGFVKYKNGKKVYAYGIKAFFNVKKMYSNTSVVDYKGTKRKYPEICKHKYMTLEEARKYCNKSQFELIEKLNELINNRGE